MPSFSMNSPSSKTASSEASAAPSFVLSLLAACSTSVPTSGSQGEATLCDQLSALLQEKAMAEDELRMLYSYRFGFSINDALQFTGFQGKLQDFLDQEKRFSVCDGCISLTPVVSATKDEAPTAVDELLAQGDRTKDDDDAASTTETESTNDAESDLDSDSYDVDIPGWHSVGNRLVATLDSLDSSNEQEVDVDAVGWKVLGGRVAAVLRDDDEEGGADAVAWHDVGSRIASACKRNSDDDCCQDASPDATEWLSVGTRVFRCLDTLEVANDEL